MSVEAAILVGDVLPLSLGIVVIIVGRELRDGNWSVSIPERGPWGHICVEFGVSQAAESLRFKL